MSFFVVPTVSYQTQQKLKKHKEKKDEKKEEKKLRKEAAAAAAASNASISDQHSKHSSHSTARGSSYDSGKKKKKSSGWSIISGRSSTSSKESKESKDNEDSRSILSNFTSKNSAVSMNDQNSEYSNEQHYNNEDGMSMYSYQSSARPQLNPVKSPSSLSVENRFDNESEIEPPIDREATPKLQQTGTAKSLPTTSTAQSPTQIEEETPSLIASNYKKSMDTDTFKQYKSMSAPSSSASNTILAAPKPNNSSNSPISPITPLTPSATYSHHTSIPYSPHSVRPRTNSAYSTSNASILSSSSNSHQQHPHYLQNYAFHRNNSLTPSSSNTGLNLTSTFTSSKESKHTFRKLSFLGSNSKRKDSTASLTASPGSESPGSSIHSQNNSYFPDPTSADSKLFLPFQPLLDLSVFNSPEEMQKVLLTPAYQVFRYNSFLSVVGSYHSSDALSFAKVRNHSLFRFIIRQQRAKKLIAKNGFNNPANFHDLSSTENILAYYLYAKTRTFLRTLIKESSKNQQLYNHEELVQCNFVNYVRYLINLPELSDTSDLNDIEQKHYEFKSVFGTIANALYSLKKDETTGVVSTETTRAIKIKLLLECITKVSYEYILLEKYRFDMFMKFHNNHLIDKRPLVQLFNTYKDHIKSHNKESPKVLLYNSANSVQYGWYLAITVPFVRFIESHIYTEDNSILQDYDRYRKLEESQIKTNFTKSDIELFDEFFSKLNLSTYQEFNAMSMDSLVKLNKLIENQSSKFVHINRREIPDPSNAFTYKPMNFEYYNKSLSTISTNTFNLIQCQDLPFQVKKENYKTILREFCRTLKPGGSFICNSIHFGSKTTEEFQLQFRDGKFPTAWNYIDFSLLKYFEAIPNFVEVILLELNEIFGKGNVKFSISLLSSTTEVNKFLIKFGGMKLFELVGKFDEYCEFFKDGENLHSSNDASIHFGVHIEAKKVHRVI
ncbi:hypothetical protein KGF54_005641 [Candida jiufengensis]|uniref:uncharacterized protein n=1 Tax=Candida jiufengensis TaxID=497108 RepID=UPI0022254E88|nr:uncharacterized protein KGF54_005641 [Candida jiufengensis]KAI5949406.1 hypothetical protein KGF54_005641 [Candida jiufengensis]